MTTSGSPVFLDTNILVYANLALSPWHAQAVQRLTALDAEGTPLETWPRHPLHQCGNNRILSYGVAPDHSGGRRRKLWAHSASQLAKRGWKGLVLVFTNRCL